MPKDEKNILYLGINTAELIIAHEYSRKNIVDFAGLLLHLPQWRLSISFIKGGVNYRCPFRSKTEKNREDITVKTN